MSVSFMVTNGGPHPPEKWADISANQILQMIQIEPTAAPSAEIEKREFGVKLFKTLCALHQKNQAAERNALKETGDRYLSTALDPTLSAKLGTTEIVKAARGTRFAAHFEKPEAQAFVNNVLKQHFADAMHIERRWYCDRNPHSEHAKAYRAKYR